MMRNWKRILAWASAAIALFAALGFLAVPPLARSQLEKLLAAELGRPVSIDRVEFNPFTLKAAVEGVTVGAREAGQPPLAGLRRLSIDAAWRSVLERAPVIRRLTVSGPQLRLVREAEGRYDIDDLIAKWAARPDDPDAPMPRFSIANIVLEDGRIDFDDRVLPRVHEVSGIEVRIPFLSSLPVHEEVDVQPRLAARIDGAELAVDGRSRPFDETRASAIDFDFDSFDLARYAGYLPAGLPVKLVSAVASGELTVEFSQPAQPGAGAPVLSITGRAGVTGLELRDPAGAPLLEVESLQAEGLRLEPLARSHVVERVAVEGAQASLQRRRGEARFLERVLVALEKPPAGRPQPSGAPADGNAGALRWSVG
ncbi:MAG TPA: DUF748 domain-containing protein, partial [Quisquiliibacterium sp.]|nr:DUF748 domain-containing protein [Quisquiliibacterium sp.]